MTHHKKRGNRTHRCKQYITSKRRGHTVLIGNKFLKIFPTPSSDKPLDIRNIPHNFLADSNSLVIGTDNHASATISNKSSHFIGVTTPVKGRTVKVFGWGVQVTGEGTLVLKIEDNDGVIHPIKINKFLYLPETPSCFLTPKQWAQQANDNYPKPSCTWCATKARHCTLYWHQERFCCTIPCDPSFNVARIWETAGGHRSCLIYRKHIFIRQGLRRHATTTNILRVPHLFCANLIWW